MELSEVLDRLRADAARAQGLALGKPFSNNTFRWVSMILRTVEGACESAILDRAEPIPPVPDYQGILAGVGMVTPVEDFPNV